MPVRLCSGRLPSTKCSCHPRPLARSKTAKSPATNDTLIAYHWLPRSLVPVAALSRELRRTSASVFPEANYPFRLAAGGWSVLVDLCDRCPIREHRPSDRRTSTSRVVCYSQSASWMSRPMARLPRNEFRDLFRLRCRAADLASGTGPTPRGRLLIPQSQHPSVTLARNVTTMAPLPRSRLRQTPLVAKPVMRGGKRKPLLIERLWRPPADSEQLSSRRAASRDRFRALYPPRPLTSPPGCSPLGSPRGDLRIQKSNVPAKVRSIP